MAQQTALTRGKWMRCVKLAGELDCLLTPFFINTTRGAGLGFALSTLGAHLGMSLPLPDSLVQFQICIGTKEPAVLPRGRVVTIDIPFDGPLLEGEEQLRQALPSIAALLVDPLSSWFDRRALRRVLDEFFANGGHVLWRSSELCLGETSALVEVQLELFHCSGELLLEHRGQQHRFALFQSLPPPRAWEPLLGTLNLAPRSVFVRAIPGDAFGTDRGGLQTGKGKEARRFTVSLETEPPEVTQRWQLTRRPLRGPLPTVLNSPVPLFG